MHFIHAIYGSVQSADIFFFLLSPYSFCAAYQLFLPGSRCLLSAVPCKMPGANNFVRNTPMRSQSHQTPAFHFSVLLFFYRQKNITELRLFSIPFDKIKPRTTPRQFPVGICAHIMPGTRNTHTRKVHNFIRKYYERVNCD